MKEVQKKVNGFDTDQLFGTLEAIKETPEIAKFQFRSKNKWIKGGHNQSEIKGFYGGCQEDTSREVAFVFDNSEPPILLGDNEGANPVEFVLHALAGCMTTTMMLYATAHGIEVDRVESKLEGDIDVQGFLGLNKEVRNGYQQISISFSIEGDLTQDQKKELINFTNNSPVFDIVTNQVPVKVNLAA